MTTSAPTPDFDLVNHDGQPVRLATYRGRHLLVFFGFTHCRMVCPRALGRLTAVLDVLGELAEQIVLLYVTVDPERDDPDTLRTFLGRTAPRFTGLTGSAAQIAAATRTFGVFSRRAPDPDDPHGYAMPHTALTYVLDRHGRYVMHFPDAVVPEKMTDRLRAVLRDADAPGAGRAAGAEEPAR